MRVASWISSMPHPAAKASRTASRRLALGVRSVFEIASWSKASLDTGTISSRGCSPKPVSPISRPRSAFCSDSLKVRPMLITSPTLFICVVSVASAPRNFSKAKRGILVTT